VRRARACCAAAIPEIRNDKLDDQCDLRLASWLVSPFGISLVEVQPPWSLTGSAIALPSDIDMVGTLNNAPTVKTPAFSW